MDGNARFTFSVTQTKRGANVETSLSHFAMSALKRTKTKLLDSYRADLLIAASFVVLAIWSLFIFADLTFGKVLLTFRLRCTECEPDK